MRTISKRSARSPSRPAAPVLAAILAAGLLAGCANVHNIEVGSIPDDYRTRHPIVVSQSTVATDLPVTASDAELSFADRGRVETMADRFKGSGADVIQVLLPVGSANQYAADRLSPQIVETLQKRGISRKRIFVQPYSAIGAAGPTPIRLSFASLVAETAPCGRWPADLGDTSENKNYYNFGCATQQNLAAQIADPRDLLSPRGVDSIDAGRRTTVIDAYRRGEATESASTGEDLAGY